MNPIDQDIALLSRRMIVQYAGIVQDFNPVHYDDEFARKAGLAGCIAQGPLTVTLVLDALVAACGAERIGSVSTRLRAPVLPGDRLHLNVDEQGKLSATVNGREVLGGSVAEPE